MATFTDIDQVKTFKLYKAALKTALGKVKAGTPVNFVYVEKYPFDDKERAMVLVDHQADLVAKLAKKPSASGKCKVNAADKFVFESPGTVHVDKVVKLFAEAGVPRAVAHPDDKADAPSREPQATQLDMMHGWSEIKNWGAEAKDLIDAYDGLVGVYRGLPEVKPGWKELVARHEEVKQAMATMVGSKIKNDKDVRLAKLTEVKELIKTVRHLAADIRTRAQEASQPQATAKPVPPVKPVDKPVQTTTTQEPPKSVAKPAFTVDDIKNFVVSTAPLNTKDTLEKYMGRARRALEGDYSGVTASHLEAVEKIAKARYFPSAEETAPKASSAAPSKPTAKIDWADRVLDVNGDKADLSDFDSTMKTKILDIAQTDGRGHHGGTNLSGSHGSCLHWRLGEMRIFGNVDSGTFTLIGTGRHSGKGNSNYKVDLLLGGTATATTG
jgi:hypothetical protein